MPGHLLLPHVKMHRANTGKCARVPVKLPALANALDKMPKFDLEHLLSELCQRDFMTGAFLGKIISKPVWWPPHIEFASTWSYLRAKLLQEVVRSCYEYYNQEQLLYGPITRGGRSMRRNANLSANSKREKVLGESTKDNQEKLDTPQFVVLEKMAMPCKASLPDLGYTGPSLPQSTMVSTLPSPHKHGEQAPVETFTCCFCGKSFPCQSEVISHQAVCKAPPPEYDLPNKSKACRQLYSDNSKSPAKSQVLVQDFAAGLGLVTKQDAASMKRKESVTEELDCEIVMIEEPKQSIPSTPRTPKSLISQLSRDASPLPVAIKKEKFDWSESESESDESIDEKPVRESQKLLNIDLTSNLGLRLKKQFSALYNSENVVDAKASPWWEKHMQYEEFCGTPKKVVTLEKLRDRTTFGYPVSFRTKKKMPTHVHIYSFNHRQRKIRDMVLRTGLSKRSRALKKLVVPCSVKLQRLSPETIHKWTVEARRKREARAVCSGSSVSELVNLLTGKNNRPAVPTNNNVKHTLNSKSKPPTPYETICISSDSEDEDQVQVQNNNKRSGVFSSQAPTAKRPKVEKPESVKMALLFMCHLCQEQLTCQNNMRQVIQGHYRRVHNVYNIDLVEHIDETGKQVISIVEMQIPSPPVLDLTEDDDVIITDQSSVKNHTKRSNGVTNGPVPVGVPFKGVRTSSSSGGMAKQSARKSLHQRTNTCLSRS